MKTSISFLPLSLSNGFLAMLLAPVAVLAQEPEVAAVAAADPVQWGLAIAFIGCAIGTFLSCIGSIMGVSMTGQAGAGLLTEKPELAGRVITLMVLPGSQGLYGMVISFLFLVVFYGEVVSGQVGITTSQGVALFAAFLPVACTCLTSSPYQAKVCSAGMHMLAKDDKLTGRVIVMAALVETYALLGFLISLFMLMFYRTAIFGA
jgi:V/A-type H+/Na+-transporting ATPase subunit K